MCRWLAYSGGPVIVGELIHKPKNNLIHQSLQSQSVRVPTNGDGSGLGWYDNFKTPGLYRSIHPAWNDRNLLDLADHIESPLFMSHVRAASLAPVQETNCHPFRYRNWLFMHNGQIADFKKLHQQLISKISPEYFDNILGSTDSEIMFHLALTYGLENDVHAAIRKMVLEIETVAKEQGIENAIWMTLAISDGISLWAFRYGSDGKSPTLFISPGLDELIKLNPAIDGKYGEFAACIVSEPIGNYQDVWQPAPQNSMVIVQEQNIEVKNFLQ